MEYLLLSSPEYYEFRLLVYLKILKKKLGYIAQNDHVITSNELERIWVEAVVQ
jgi:hypothetical protein